MTYTLYVSHDCGCSYSAEATADSPDAFAERGKQLDADWLRWYVEDERGEMAGISRIHAEIVAFMATVATPPPPSAGGDGTVNEGA